MKAEGLPEKLQEIVDLVKHDFGVTITTETAEDIIHASTVNCCSWTSVALITTDRSRIYIYKWASGRVETNVGVPSG